MGLTRFGVAPWFVAGVLAAGAFAAPGLNAQEVGPPHDGATVNGPHFNVLAGLHLPLGASLDLAMNGSRVPVWVSAQFMIQMHHFEQRSEPWRGQYSPLERRRAAIRAARFRLGLGKVRGPRIYAVLEAGVGVIAPSETWDRESYGFVGLGPGLGWAFRRWTVSIDGTIGETSDNKFHVGGALSLQYHLRRHN